MTLFRLGQLIAALLTGQITLLQLGRELLDRQQDVARETYPKSIEQATSLILLALNTGTSSLGSILAAITAMHEEMTTSLSGLLAAIGALPVDPVILPVTPPAGYGGASASDVWDFLLGDPYTAGNMLFHLHEKHEHLRGLASYHVCANPWFFVYYPVGEGD